MKDVFWWRACCMHAAATTESVKPGSARHCAAPRWRGTAAGGQGPECGGVVWVHARPGAAMRRGQGQGAMPSTFWWHSPARCSICISHSCTIAAHRAHWPVGFGLVSSHCSAAWSVTRVKWTPNMKGRHVLIAHTAVDISPLEASYFCSTLLRERDMHAHMYSLPSSSR